MESVKSSEQGEIRRFFRIPMSVHYEVAVEERLHPYIDSCPYCGITGDYAVPIDKSSQDYCIKIHDPLGLELILDGTIRKKRVLGLNGGRIRCLSDLERYFSCSIRRFESSEDEPRKMAVVAIAPSREEQAAPNPPLAGS